MRLLLVEDEEKTSTYLNRALSESGFLITFIININVQFFIKKSRQGAVREIQYPTRIALKHEIKQPQILHFQFHAYLLFFTV